MPLSASPLFLTVITPSVSRDGDRVLKRIFERIVDEVFEGEGEIVQVAVDGEIASDIDGDLRLVLKNKP